MSSKAEHDGVPAAHDPADAEVTPTAAMALAESLRTSFARNQAADDGESAPTDIAGVLRSLRA